MNKSGALFSCWGVVIALLSLALGVSCRPQVTKRTSAEVALPEHLTEPREQRAYLVAHYWDKLLVWPEEEPQRLSRETEDFCSFIVGLSPQEVRPSLYQGLEALSPQSLALVLPIYKRCLYTAGSPSYDEAIYAEVLRWQSQSEKIDSLGRVEAVLELARLRHNALGRVAQDFRFHERDSLSSRLLNFRAPYTLLLLLRDSTAQLQGWSRDLSKIPSLTRLIEQDKLRPLVIYTGSSRPDSLARTYLPKGTTWAYDSAGLIARERRYDLQHGSGLYLLDDHKRILLRNGTLPQVNQILTLR